MKLGPVDPDTEPDCDPESFPYRSSKDQIRTIDKTRLIKKLGTIDSKSQADTIDVLQSMFAF